jgi:hypothetical protein
MIGGSYKTAWYLCHRIRAAMKRSEDALNWAAHLRWTRPMWAESSTARERGARSLKSKEVVIGIKQRGGELRFFHAEDVKSGTLAKYIKENVSEDVDVIMTDEFGAYPSAIGKAGVLARAQDHQPQRWHLC